MDLEVKFQDVTKLLAKQFGDDLDIQGVLFIIGVQELGKGRIKLSKNEKLDVMHIAICTLLTPYGYYEYEGLDVDGWPHWKTSEKLPPLNPSQQQRIIKEAIIDYFKAEELIATINITE
jgi:hypothetical protein